MGSAQVPHRTTLLLLMTHEHTIRGMGGRPHSAQVRRMSITTGASPMDAASAVATAAPARGSSRPRPASASVRSDATATAVYSRPARQSLTTQQQHQQQQQQQSRARPASARPASAAPARPRPSSPPPVVPASAVTGPSDPNFFVESLESRARHLHLRALHAAWLRDWPALVALRLQQLAVAKLIAGPAAPAVHLARLALAEAYARSALWRQAIV